MQMYLMPLNLKMVKTVNFVLCTSYHNYKKKLKVYFFQYWVVSKTSLIQHPLELVHFYYDFQLSLGQFTELLLSWLGIQQLCDSQRILVPKSVCAILLNT